MTDQPERKLHRVFVTVSVPLSIDTHAVDGQEAWNVVTHPANRAELVRRIQTAPANLLAQTIELQGFAEELNEQTEQVRPFGTIHARNEVTGPTSTNGNPLGL